MFGFLEKYLKAISFCLREHFMLSILNGVRLDLFWLGCSETEAINLVMKTGWIK